MLTKLKLQVVLGCLVLLAGLNTARGEDVKAWDVPVPAAGGDLQFDQRADWKPLGQGDAKNCAVLDNGHLLLAVIPGSEGALVYSKPQGTLKGTAVRLSFLYSQGKVALPVLSSRLAHRSATEAILEVTLGGKAQAVSLRLRPGRSFVEIWCDLGVGSVRVCNELRYAFRPDLFGTDVFYAPTMPIFEGKDIVPLPVENYLLGVLNQDGAVLCAWEGSGRKASLNLSGTGRERQFKALDIGFPDKQAGSEHRPGVCVAFLEAPGICRYEDLTDSAAKLSGSEIVSLQPAWTAPFSARWYTLICHDERVGGGSSLHLPVVSWPLAGKIRPGKPVLWAKSGEIWSEDDRQPKPHRAAWYDGRRWGLDLEKACAPFSVALNYPMGRMTQTPGSALTVIDLLRETLPETWQQVLDLKGLEQRGRTAGKGKMVPAVCAALYDLGKLAEDPLKQAETRAQAAALEAYLWAYDARSQEYLKFSAQLRELCADAAQRTPQVAALSARLIAASRELDTEWERLKKDQGLDPGQWGSGVKKTYAVIDTWAASADVRKKDLDALHDAIYVPGVGYAYFVAIARKVVRNLNYVAVYGGSENEETLKLSATVQSRCHQVLRNRYMKEDQYGESVEGPLPNPERPTEQAKQ